MRTTAPLTVVLLLLTFALSLQAQNSSKAAEPEQSSFGGEEVPGIPFIKRPVSVPDSVLQLLKKADTVKGCLSDNEPTPDKPFSSWFVASEVHLGGRSERDLVVLPSPRAGQPDYGCFHSASGIQSLWVFRQTGGQYRLVLTTVGNGIDIMKIRHNGYRDIQSVTVGRAGRFITTITFHFDGGQYQRYQEETKENQ
jgi:hypothetical protein